MNDLVSVMKNQAVTTSLKVAEVFEKNHQHVMRDIRDLIAEMASESESPKLDAREMFQKSTYTIEGNFKKYPMYYINRDGFTLLAMGFTGKKALSFKLAYISAFNAMENALKERSSQSWIEARKSSKFTNRQLTDAIRDYIIPNARANGSNAPDSVFYMNYNKLLNKVANVPAGQRDNLTFSDLIMLDQMQNVAAANIRIKSESGSAYKEVYSATKDAVEGYARVALVAERLERLMAEKTDEKTVEIAVENPLIPLFH